LNLPLYLGARFIGATLRIEVEGWEKVVAVREGKIIAGWHGRSFIPAILFRNRGYWAIISQSRDGQMQNRVFQRFGFQTIRGSTGRGGARAAVQAIRVLREGETMAFTPDGPRGPNEVVQMGVIVMAQRSGAALIPIGTSAHRRWIAPAWDRYMIPKPFSRAIAVFGDPIYVDPDADEQAQETARAELESAIRELQVRAEARMGHGMTER
jgi:lysophospholipid acyltransferase (LPLAT)-like uncharacterized protein